MSESTPRLDGVTVGITAARKAAEQARMVTDLGGIPVVGPTMQTIPLEDDPVVADALDVALDVPATFVVLITGIGTRGLMRAAEAYGRLDDLQALVTNARRFARGPKARAALREYGFDVEWTPPSETSEELLRELCTLVRPGDRVVLQLHGDPMPDFAERLVPMGVDVVDIPVYRWVPPDDPVPGTALVRAICAGEIDAVTFTSAPAVRGLFALAEQAGQGADLDAALGDVVVVSVGPVTAEALDDRHVRIDVQPDLARMGVMYKALAAAWPDVRSVRSR